VQPLSDPDTPQPIKRKDLIKQLSPIGSPEASPVKKKRVKISKALSPTPSKKGSEFITHDYDDFDELSVMTPPEPAPSKRKKRREIPSEELSALPSFKMPDGLNDLADQARAFIDQDNIQIPLPSSLTHNEQEVRPRENRCPMCKKFVDDDYLQKFKSLSTRMQMKSCQSHQKNSAGEEWKLKGYPLINWDELDSRIDKHHPFIVRLIKGADCHSRALLEERVQAGKDRNLLTTTSNLTPGYYGARGLRAISEHVMGEFSKLLMKRAVKDKLVAARGVTGFVQAVVVPEVTVLLISDDMDVGIQEARDILTDSIGLGEMVHEEIRDVVKRRVRDSDNDDDLDD
jgi:hypothetical protein